MVCRMPWIQNPSDVNNQTKGKPMKSVQWAITALFLSYSSVSAAFILITPWKVDFGKVQMGQIPSRQIIRVMNQSQKATRLRVTNSCTGEFFLNQGTCFMTLQPYGSCFMSVEFSPRSPGLKNCDIWIQDSFFNFQTLRVSGDAIPLSEEPTPAPPEN